ncbi:MAG: NAD(P)-dependent glycerol-3-phosphate dehydrogenase [Eggerthellaceae bacterium]|nr:NAD(P)-dependent glycerol-3-phosphate dehydrogenase [Eggerthellaceae bacterium]
MNRKALSCERPVAVIGAGSWGTAISNLLGNKGYSVRLWARKPSVADAINSTHHNPRYLSATELSSNVVASSSLEEVLDDVRAVAVVTPSSLLREFGEKMEGLMGYDEPLVICSKGVEADTGKLAIEIFSETIKNPSRLAVLSGPTHAEEVIKGLPSATVIASDDEKTALYFRDMFATETFRTYTSDDPIGVELCGAFKNVIAIAVGVSYGIGFGDNTAALLITRGLAEMSRMGGACGGHAMTALGLAGAGDMMVTCMSSHSRNRTFGQYYVAKGKTLNDFTEENHMVVEGALACKTLGVLAKLHDVDLPITTTVRQVVWEGMDPAEAVTSLASRPLKSEF